MWETPTHTQANIAQRLVLWSSKPETTVRICLFAPNGPEVKRLRYLPVTEYGAGSTPVKTAIPLWCNGNTTVFGAVIHGSNPCRGSMSKRYSESSNQDLKNDSAESLRREWDFVGIKESDTPPPSSVDCFHEGCLAGFWNSRKNRNNYSSVISRWGHKESWQSGRTRRS